MLLKAFLNACLRHFKGVVKAFKGVFKDVFKGV